MTTLTTLARSIGGAPLLVAVAAAPALAQRAPAPDGTAGSPSADAVIERLTQQVAALEAEIARLTANAAAAATVKPEPSSEAAEIARLGAELDALDQRVRVAQRKL